MENKIYTYIKRNVGIVEYDFQLVPEMYNVGYTYEDYMNNAWVELTEEHKAFREQYPNCSPKEMFDLQKIEYIKPIIPTERSLKEVKMEMILKINQYDTSIEVNSFYLNDSLVWLDKSTRVGLMNSMQIEKATGRTESTLWFNNVCYTVPIDTAIQMLQALELYALACYNKTEEHKANINSLTDINEVKQYDITSGYPEKLEFNTNSL